MSGTVGSRSARAMCRLAALVVLSAAALIAQPPAAADTPAPASTLPAGAAAPPAGATTTTAPVAPNETAGPRPPPARLTVFNRPIVLFRVPLFGVPPGGRAEDAAERIDSILARGGPGVVSVSRSGASKVFTVDGQLVFALLPGDVSDAGPDALDAAANAAKLALERAITETQEARDGRLLARAGLHAAIATIVYAVLTWLLVRAGRWLRLRVLKLADAASARLRVGGGELVRSHRAMRIARTVLRAFGWLVFLLVTFEWLGFVLGRFPYTRAWSEQLHGFLFDTAANLLISVAHATPGLMIAIVIVLVARAVDGVQKSFFHRVQDGRIRVGWIDKDSAPPTRRLATLAVWAFAAVMAYPYIPGSSTDAFKGLTVLLGLMVSVGASGLVGQAASGLILMYTRTMRPGDFVRVGEAEGTITTMGVFTTRVHTGMGEELTLPNATILGSVTRNFSRSAQREGIVLTADVSIGYDVPWRQVAAMLVAAAQRTPGVRTLPAPRVYQTALGDFNVAYRLACESVATAPGGRAEASSALYAAILDVFNEHGVQIMSPHYLGDPATPKVVPPADWHKPPAQPPSDARRGD